MATHKANGEQAKLNEQRISAAYDRAVAKYQEASQAWGRACTQGEKNLGAYMANTHYREGIMETLRAIATEDYTMLDKIVNGEPV